MDDNKDLILIDLDIADNAAQYDQNSLFQKDAFQRMEDLIIRHLSRIESGKSNHHTHHHHTLFVTGPRGSGKTSFVLSLLNHLRIDSKFKDDVAVLDMLDPSLVEDQEVFLATVVSNILRQLQGHLKCKADAEKSWQEIYGHIEKMAPAFRLVVPTGGKSPLLDSVMGDPRLFAEELLQTAHSGLELDKNIGALIEACVRALGVKCLVLPLDDVDTAVRRGWLVLETLRRYLGHLTLLPVLSGDMDLYRLLVRKEKAETISGVMTMDPDETNKSRYWDQILHLEEQYLEKVLPSHLRIELFPFSDQIQRAAYLGEDVCKIRYGSGESLRLSHIFLVVSKHAFLWQPGDDGAIIRESKTAPILSPVYYPPAKIIPGNTRQFVRFLTWAASTDGAIGNDSISSDARKIWMARLCQVFDGVLAEHYIKPSDLAKLAEGQDMGAFGHQMLEIGFKIPEIWRLSARYALTDKAERHNQLALVLQAMIHQSWKDKPHLALEYCFQVVWPGLYADRQILNLKSRQELAQALHLRLDENLFDTAGRLLAYDLGRYRTLPHELPGATRLPIDGKRHQITAKKVLAIVKPPLANLLKSPIYTTDQFNKRIAGLPKLLLDWFSDRYSLISGDVLHVLSITRGLAAIADILRSPRTEENVRRQIQTVIQERNYPIISRIADSEISNAGDQNELDDSDQDLVDDQLNTEVSLLQNELLRWAEKMDAVCRQSGGSLPSSTMARVWVRFEDNLNKIYDGLELDKTTVGRLMRLWTAAWLNSLMIEEFYYRSTFSTKNTAPIRVDHLDRDTRNLIHNINSLRAAKFPMTYTEAWLECPILLLLLDEPEFQIIITDKEHPMSKLRTVKIKEINATCDIYQALSILVPSQSQLKHIDKRPDENRSIQPPKSGKEKLK